MGDRKFTGYRYANIWSKDQEKVLALFESRGQKRANAVRRLRELEAKGLTAADILAQFELPFANHAQEKVTCK